MRIVAIPTGVAEEVRRTMRGPFHGLPAHRELAGEGVPCRHCLRLIAAGEEAILFTYDRFSGIDQLPQPGPVYVHARECARYDESGGFPEELRGSPRTLEGYGQGRRLVAQRYVTDGMFEAAVAELFGNEEVEYVQVHSTTAGCFTFRIEREARGLNELTKPQK